jgi:hypothetical protein
MQAAKAGAAALRGRTYGLVLGADIVYNGGDVPALVATVGAALRPGGTLRVMNRAGREGLPEFVTALAGLGKVQS